MAQEASSINRQYIFVEDNPAPLGIFRQLVSAQTTFTLDYSGWLAANEFISAISYSIFPTTASPLIVTNSTVDTTETKVTFQVGGGDDNTRYQLFINAQTTNSQTKADQISITIATLLDGYPPQPQGAGELIDQLLSGVTAAQTAAAQAAETAALFASAIASTLPKLLALNLAGAAPANTVGIDGDWAVDSTSLTLWGPKAAGAWPSSPAITNNNVLRMGIGAPADATGIAGDYYLDAVTRNVYGPKTSSWPSSPRIVANDGNVVMGAATPATTTGETGDYFVNIVTGAVYGPKTSSGWPATPTNTLITPATEPAIPAAIPVGGVIFWYSTLASIPDGWGLCDGSTYARSDGLGNIISPNTLNRVIIAAGSSYSPGDTGGSSSHGHSITVGNTTLTVAQLPAFTINITETPHTHDTSETPHAHNFYAFGNATTGPYGYPSTTGNASAANVATSSASTGLTVNAATTGIQAAPVGLLGSAHEHSGTAAVSSNLMPYYALPMIMKL